MQRASAIIIRDIRISIPFCNNMVKKCCLAMLGRYMRGLQMWNLVRRNFKVTTPCPNQKFETIKLKSSRSLAILPNSYISLQTKRWVDMTVWIFCEWKKKKKNLQNHKDYLHSRNNWKEATKCTDHCVMWTQTADMKMLILLQFPQLTYIQQQTMKKLQLCKCHYNAVLKTICHGQEV